MVGSRIVLELLKGFRPALAQALPTKGESSLIGFRSQCRLSGKTSMRFAFMGIAYSHYALM
jgi:fatty acid/phospholipid biosynthesis enzyme